MLNGIRVAYLVAVILVFIGWVGNFFHLFSVDFGHGVTTDAVLTVLGLFLPPVGAVNFFFF